MMTGGVHRVRMVFRKIGSHFGVPYLGHRENSFHHRVPFDPCDALLLMQAGARRTSGAGSAPAHGGAIAVARDGNERVHPLYYQHLY